MIRLDPINIPLAGTHLIEASAGTGKTYTITSLFLRLILSGYRIEDILVVTFTEAATSELRDRLRVRLREALDGFRKRNETDDGIRSLFAEIPSEDEFGLCERRLEAALSGFDEASVFTIHGFCHRMLQEHAFESGVLFDAELQTDPGPVYEEIVRDFWAIEVYHLPVLWVRVLEEKKIGPKALIHLLRIAAGNRDRRILPDMTEALVDIVEYGRLFFESRQIWLSKETEIRNIIETHPGINRNSFKAPHLQNWFDNTAEYFSYDSPQRLPGERDLEKFRRSRIIETAGKKKNSSSPPSHPFFDCCERLCGFAEKWVISFQRRFLDQALIMLAEKKRFLGILFFDDLIQALDRALSGPGGAVLCAHIRKRYRAALIDEFQDTDQAQYRIFQTLFQGEGFPFFLIGDPKQSIYAFRGADVFAYMRAAQDAGDSTHNLDINWRSDPSLIRAVNLLFDAGRISRPFGFREIGYIPVLPRDGAVDYFPKNGISDAALQFLFVERNDNTSDRGGLIRKDWVEDHLPAMVAGDICKLLSGSTPLTEKYPTPLSPGDIAVLVRTNRQARLIQAALRRLGVPCVVSDSESVFSSSEAFELLQVLYAVESPTDEVRINTALSTGLFDITGNELLAMQNDGSVWEGWLTRFRYWRDLWVREGVAVFLWEVFTFKAHEKDTPLLLSLLVVTDGERRVTNFQHLAELLHAASVREHLGPGGLLRWFEWQRAGRGEASETHEMRLESDAQAVKVVTIHKSKGLEYPVVYVPYPWDGKQHVQVSGPVVCHDPAEIGQPLLDLGSERLKLHLDQAAVEEMAENLRLLYVALTRAKHACRIVWGAINDFHTSALGYLLHHPGGDAGFKEVSQRILKMDDSDILKDLKTFAIGSAGAIGVRMLTMEEVQRYQPARGDAHDLACRKARVFPERLWRLESFSGLVMERSPAGSPEEEKGLDHDQRAIDTAGSQVFSIPFSSNMERILLADFSRGADAGTFFHAVYEKIDFTEADTLVLEKSIGEELLAHGFSATEWRDIITRSVAETLACRLDGDDGALRLNRIPSNSRFNELEFLFPVGVDMKGSRTRVTAKSLVEVFKAFDGPANTEVYLSRLSRLSFPAIQGYLKGFIDLVFEYEGRWYLIDYKSNHLGDTYSDYGADALTQEMAYHHYFLQYHIYAVALHRYLSCRMPDYDYDTHFGAVYYLFIRGMSPGTGPDLGVFKDRPGKALIDALSGLFGSTSC